MIQNVTVEAGNLPGDGITLSFKAEGFSVYAVVAAPEMPEIQEEAVASLQELSQNTAKAFYLSVTRSGSVNYFQNELNGNSAFKVTGSVSSAAEWYFEPVQGQANRYRIYTLIDGNRKYIKNTSGNLAGLADSDGTAFDLSMAADRLFYLKMNDQNKWLQYSKGGIGIRFYTDNNNNENSRVTLTYVSSTELPEDPLGLDGKTYGLMNYSDGLKGEAMMAAAKNNTALTAQPAIVRTDPQDREEKMYIAQNTDISMWTFHAVEGGLYTLSATVDGETKYLKITASGLSLVDEEDASAIHVTSGTGANQGKLRLSCTGGAVSFEGTNGFKAADSGNAKEWLHLVEKSSLTDEDFVIRSAVKVSVSDTEKVKDGAQILIYKRVWNDIDKRYEYYAIDQDGGLVPCYESGDSIEWVGTKLNKLLWTFTEGYYEGTTTPNYYYQLYNPYSEKYLFPGIKDGQSLSDEPASVNLNGRRYGDYYTSIIAWDDPYYTYAGLKSEDGRIVSCPMAQAEDFYFAIMQEEEEQDELTEVATVDHTENGITVKIVDFGNKAGDIIKGDGCTTSQEQHDVMGVSKYIKDQVQNLVSTRLDDQGYPVSTTTGRSLADLYAEAEEVNHLFIADIYKGTGYYEFDSTQNFASLQNDLTFKVYQQLGTIDQQQKPSLKHGQFMPYNDLTPGVYARDNGENLYNAEQQPLPDDDPRKYERLYKINNPDHYFGLELEASFVQTPNGKDAWGHDIIYEFTGDDDFWLYVDGELVINLGGIHGALGGKVNYSTGEAVINGQPTTLYAIFRKNYADRNNLSENDPAVIQYLDEIFTVNGHGQYVFKDYTSHTMRIFFMERGGGASNLYMRFNLAAVKPDQILLNKKLSGTDKKDYKLAEYPFQIFYKMEEDGDEYQLGPRTDGKYNVTYQNSSTPVPYSPSYRVPGGTSQYSDVFFLGAEDTAAITLPEDAVGYRIVECGLNTQVYDRVSVNEEEVTGQASADTNRKDYSTAYDTMENRRHVSFDNHVNENAIRTLTISKKLFEPDGTTPVADDDAGFNFRLSLGSENDDELPRASLQEYCVRDAEGNYCRYDPDRQMFLSLEKTSFEDLTETEKEAAVFHTSMNGAISKIPADYKVEVRDLFVGTKFAVTEEDYEIPPGYDFISYEREGSTYIVEEGETVNTGIIRESESPAVIVNNKRGWGLTAKKKWSDADFVDSHEDIFFAVYVNGSMLPGTIRRLQHPSTSVYYYFDTLEAGTTFADYEIREVTLSGNYTVDSDGVVSGNPTVHVLNEGNTLKAYATHSGEEKKYDYVVSYAIGSPTGKARNARTDTVTNSRVGIILKKTDWNGSPLAGAAFELRDGEGSLISGKAFESDTDGIITTAYLNVGEEYTLTETAAPGGYAAMPGSMRFKIGHNEKLTILEGDSEYYTLDTPANGKLGTITVKNRPMVFQVIKTDGAGGQALGGAHFALYGEKTDGHLIEKDDNPMDGFADLVSAEGTGLVPQINETLPAGTFYLEEKESPDPGKYAKLTEDIRFSVSRTGQVSLLSQSGNVTLESTVTSGDASYEDGTLVYTMTIPNGSLTVPLRIVKVDQMMQPLEGARFDISFEIPGGQMTGLTGQVSAASSPGGDALIYENNAMPPGTVTLTETSQPEGYLPLEGPAVVQIQVKETGITVTAAINGTEISYPYIERDKDTGVWTVRILNSSGVELPHTGGPGTGIFTLSGLLLLAAAGVMRKLLRA